MAISGKRLGRGPERGADLGKNGRRPPACGSQRILCGRARGRARIPPPFPAGRGPPAGVVAPSRAEDGWSLRRTGAALARKRAACWRHGARLASRFGLRYERRAREEICGRRKCVEAPI